MERQGPLHRTEANEDVPLATLAPGLRAIHIVVDWKLREGAPWFELDLVAFLPSKNGLVTSEDDFVFFNALEAQGGVVTLEATPRRDGNLGWHAMRLELVRLRPPGRVLLAVAPGQGAHRFEELERVGLRVLDETARSTLLEFELRPHPKGQGAVRLAEIYPDGHAWRLRTLGEQVAEPEPGQSPLGPLVSAMGIEVS